MTRRAIYPQGVRKGMARRPRARGETPGGPQTPGTTAPRDQRRLRAMEERLAVRLRNAGPLVSAEVRNPFHQTVHRVYLPAFPSAEPALCDCVDFARGGAGTCKHVEAARLELAEGPPAMTTARAQGLPAEAAQLWKEIDARLAEMADLPGSRARRYRWTGSALVGAGSDAPT